MPKKGIKLPTKVIEANKERLDLCLNCNKLINSVI